MPADDSSFPDADAWLKTASNSNSPINPSLARSLHDLEHSLKCPVCQDFLHAPVSIQPCQHVFCSLCIHAALKTAVHTSLQRQAVCPVCRAVVESNHSRDYKRGLVPNKQLETVVMHFTRLRQDLLQTLQNSGNSSSSSTRTTVVPENDNSNEQDGALQEEASTRRRSRRVQEAATLDEATAAPEATSETAVAPVLQQPHHEDPPPQPRPKMRAVFYNNMKRKRLQELCADQGLGIAGTDQELRQRHEGWTVYYNAECDASRPRPVAQLRKLFLQEEAARARATTADVDCFKRVIAKRGTDNHAATAQEPRSLSTGHAAFDAKFASNFEKLIAQAKARKQKQKQAAAAAAETPRTAAVAPETANSLAAAAPSAAAVAPETAANTALPSTNVHPSSTVATSAVDPMGADPSTAATSAVLEESTHETASSPGAAQQEPATALVDSSGENSAIESLHPPAVPETEDPGDDEASTLFDPTTIQKVETVTPAAPQQAANDALDDDLENRVVVTKKKRKTLDAWTLSSRPRKSASPPDNNRNSSSTDGSKNNASNSSSMIGPWSCTVCTFYNQTNRSSRAKCEMCHSVRNKSVAQTPQNEVIVMDAA